MYEPKLARFKSRDPLPAGGVDVLHPVPDMRGYLPTNDPGHPYVYVRNDPTNLVDPSGLRECKCNVTDPPGIQVTQMQPAYYPDQLNGFFGRTFKTHVEFTDECRCCEYRQFVKGYGTRARFIAAGARWQYGDSGWGFQPPPNQNVWREDCAGIVVIVTALLAECYGHRAQPDLGSDTYSQPNRLTGCVYDAVDTPGQPEINQLRQAGPQFKLEVEMSLFFRLIVHDSCRQGANGQPMEVARVEFPYTAKATFDPLK